MGRMRGEMKNEYKILIWKPEGSDYLGDIVIEGRIILKWNF
jgi:hypothetical protein